MVCIQDGKITQKYETGSENYAVAVSADLGKVCVGIDEVGLIALLVVLKHFKSKYENLSKELICLNWFL